MDIAGPYQAPGSPTEGSGVGVKVGVYPHPQDGWLTIKAFRAV